MPFQAGRPTFRRDVIEMKLGRLYICGGGSMIELRALEIGGQVQAKSWLANFGMGLLGAVFLCARAISLDAGALAIGTWSGQTCNGQEFARI